MESNETAFDWNDLAATAGSFVAFLVFFEVLIWSVFTHTHYSHSSLRQYLWYGASYESKLRELADTPNLPTNSILYAGWLDNIRTRALPRDVDITVYGMSFSGQLADVLHELRPNLTQRDILGPGAPLSHEYASYEIDKELRKTRFGVIGVTSGAVQEVVLMNRGTLFSDAAFPYFFPRYKMDHDRVVLDAESLINSADELRRALGDPALWNRQLEVLAQHDPAYRRFYFAKDFLDYSVLGRFVRRGMAKRHSSEYSDPILGPHGFNPKSEAPRLFRGLLRQMIVEMRMEGVQPIVALFSLEGQGNFLYDLVEDILRQEKVSYVNSFDYCPSDDRKNYKLDMHFVHECNKQFAQHVLDIVDSPPH